MTRLQLRPSLGLAAAALCGLSTQGFAQGFNNQWLTVEVDTAQTDISNISNNSTETDLHWADFDGDGWTDVVVVRKQPYTSAGKRTNVLLMNEGGILKDMTATLATAADIPGDQGFLTPTNDRDVRVADFDLDGNIDFVTATTLSDGDPKHIGHPRVYMNQGEVAGAWQGMRFEDARFPQFFQFNNGNPQNPRFCSVATGDVTGDGFPDMYFGDYDSSGAGGGGQTPSQDLNDRLVINDGTAFFADESQARMTSQMLKSAFGNSVIIADFNQDGNNDIVKNTSLNAPQYVAISYAPTTPGQFTFFDDFHSFQPYHTSEGDLNNDGRLDLVISDDFSDRFRINEGNTGFGLVDWSSAKQFTYLSGGDLGFASNNLIADLNNDGFDDVLVCDIDVDIQGTQRRMNLYNNATTVAGTSNVVLREERQQANNNGWIGAVGFNSTNLRGAHDVGVFDIDRDGDNDILLSTFDGTEVYRNQLNPELCQTDLGFGGPGNVTLSLCGQPLFENNVATLTVDSDQPASPGVLAVSDVLTPLPLFGGTLVALPAVVTINFVTDGAGDFSFDYTATDLEATLYLQSVVIDLSLPELIAISNAIEGKFNL